VGGSARAAPGGYGTTGYDAIVIRVSDQGHSDRACGAGGADPLAVCALRPGAPQTARAVIELSVRPAPSGEFGDRAAAAALQADRPCLPCYAAHPADPDLCMHVQLYWAAPDAPGHSYSRAAMAAYAPAQRAVWARDLGRPCAGFYRAAFDDRGGDVRVADRALAGLGDGEGPAMRRGALADAISHGHGDPTPPPAAGDDDLRRLMDAAAAPPARPWEGR
jgi:hypothetical protein